MSLCVADTEVSCVFQESCILPCSFLGSTDAVISWSLLKARHVSILSYNSKQDQLTQQDEHFRGRASLFKDQISNGNASLQLTSVEFQDEGRYKCATGGNNDSFISLKVDGTRNIQKTQDTFFLLYICMKIYSNLCLINKKTFQDKIIFLE